MKQPMCNNRGCPLSFECWKFNSPPDFRQNYVRYEPTYTDDETLCHHFEEHPDLRKESAQPYWNILVFAVLTGMALVALFILSSCVTAKKCAARYPAQERLVSVTETIPGETVYNYDTLYVDCDSVVEAASHHVPGVGNKINTKYVRVPCPPSSHRVDTNKTTVTITVIDQAKVIALTKDLNKANATIARKNGTLKVLWWIVGILGLYTIGRIVLKKFTGFGLL